MAKKGKLLEQLVGRIQEVIKDNDGTSIETGVKFNDTFGILREFDVFVRATNQGLAMNIAFECKDYSTSKNKQKVDVKVVDALIGKCKDCPEINNKIIVSTTGFTSSAIKKAAANGITLLAIEDIKSESILAPSNVKLMKSLSKLGNAWLYLYGNNQLLQSDQIVECWDSNTDIEINILDCIKQQMNWSDLLQEQTKAYIKNGQKRTDMFIAFEISNMYIKDINNHKYPLYRILIPFRVDFETYEGQIEQVQHLTQGSFDVDTTTFGFGIDGVKIKSIAAKNKQECYFQINDTLKTPKFIGKL